LHYFTSSNSSYAINTEGENPGNASLTLSGNTLYGTTFSGGTSANGTIFKVNVDGTGFSILHTFSEGSGDYPSSNNDGAHPSNGVILSGHTLYGTTTGGGKNGNGTVFSLSTNGTGFISFYQFTPGTPPSFVNADGAGPCGLVLLDNVLYGMASSGGLGYGTIFSLSPPPELDISPAGQDVVLSWPINTTGYILQYTTNLVDWTPFTTTLTVVNGWNTASIGPASTKGDACRFYRLSR